MNFVRLIAVWLAIAIFGFTAPARASSNTDKSNSAVPASDLIDINHTNAAQLRALPGIGEAYSVAIVKNRPYKNKTQLKSRGIIPLAAYNRIKKKIVAKQ